METAQGSRLQGLLLRPAHQGGLRQGHREGVREVPQGRPHRLDQHEAGAHRLRQRQPRLRQATQQDRRVR